MCGTTEVIGGDPRAVERQCTLPPEKLVTLVVPVEGVDGAIVCGELQLAEARRLLAGRSDVLSPLVTK
jgi:hypothetical protein